MMSKARYTAVNKRPKRKPVAVEMVRYGFSAKNQIRRTIEVLEDGGEPFVRVLVLAKSRVRAFKARPPQLAVSFPSLREFNKTRSTASKAATRSMRHFAD